MNTYLKPTRLIATCAVLCLCTALSAQDTTTTSTIPPQPQTPDYHKAAVMEKESGVSRSDHMFLEKAAKSGMKEVAVSQAVLPFLTTQAAKDLAQMMIKDHTAANDELKTLAIHKGVSLPPENEKIAKKWSEKSKDIDEAYLKEMVSDHKDAVALFEKGTKADDADIAAFAQKTLPALQHHLEMAKSDKAAR